jgi:hypothetical protein
VFTINRETARDSSMVQGRRSSNTQDYDGLKNGHYDSLTPLGDELMNGYTGLRLESGTAEMSANSATDIGLFNNGSVSVDSVSDELGLYSEVDIETNQVETEAICEEEDVGMDVSAEASEVKPEGELPNTLWKCSTTC